MKTAIVRLLIAGVLAAGLRGEAVAQEVVAVLSSESAPYEEAFAGVQEAYGRPIPVYSLSHGKPDIPDDVRVIVAIGGQAAVFPYRRPDAALVYCVAPGIYLEGQENARLIGKVYVSPPPAVLLRRLRELQPGLRRLAAFWVDASALSYGDALKAEGLRQGITLRTARLGTAQALPEELRALRGRVDALWLPPDPLLINPESFSVARQFCWDNGLPLYVSIDTLADKGAAAAVFVSFRDMGRRAGTLAAQAAAGSSKTDAAAFGDHVSVTVNISAAKRSGLAISAGALSRADRVMP